MSACMHAHLSQQVNHVYIPEELERHLALYNVLEHVQDLAATQRNQV